MAPKNYDGHDLEIAKELGALTKSIMNMDERMSSSIAAQTTQFNALWSRVDEHTKDISRIKGIGFGIQALWAIIIGWLGWNK